MDVQKMASVSLTDIRAMMNEDEQTVRMSAARDRAQWELGDPSWAEVIIGAYLNPVEDADALVHEKGE